MTSQFTVRTSIISRFVLALRYEPLRDGRNRAADGTPFGLSVFRGRSVGKYVASYLRHYSQRYAQGRQ